jgi:CRP-like cAMP-binding protein
MVGEAARASGGGGWPPDSLLGLVDPETRATVLKLGRLREYEAGAVLVRQGDRGSAVFLISAGAAKVTVAGSGGTEVTIALRLRGEVVGEMAMLDAAPRSATVTAMAPLSAYVIDAAVFQRFLADNAAVEARLHQMSRGRMRSMMDDRADLAGGTTELRLARLLLRLAEAHGRPGSAGVRLEVPLSQRELASLIDRSEVSVGRGIAELRRHGALRAAPRGRILLDVDQLSRFVEDADSGRLG